MAGSERPEPVAVQELEAAARDIIEQAIKQLSTARLSKPTQLLAQAALTTLKRQRDYNEVITDVGRLTDEISQVSAVLTECAAALVTAEEEAARRSPGTDIWWNTRIRAVRRALSAGRPDVALQRLASAWVDGLARQDWRGCRNLLSQPGLPAQLPGALDQMAAVTDALEEGAYEAALDPLDGLLDPHAAGIDHGAAVRLGVLRTRILIREYSDSTSLLESAEQTLSRADTEDGRSLALAGLAEAQLARDEVDAARTALAEATVVQLPATDVLVAAGLLFERDGLSTTADEYYDRAVRGDPAATQPALLRRVPPRLLLRAAQSDGISVEESLGLLDRITAEEMSGEETDLERDIHLLRAEQLTKLAAEEETRGQADAAGWHRGEAAGSWVAAANRYLWSGLIPQALQLFRRACDLAPELAENHWAYAEGLRLDAFRADGTLDLPTLWRANAEIRRGLSLRAPDDGEGSVLVTQALILEGLSDRRPDPVLLIERALLKNFRYEVGYGFLARMLRRQGFPQEALEASSDGRRTAGTSEMLLFEEHLSVLLDFERYDEALRLIDQQSVRQPNTPELRCHRADVLLRTGRPADGLAALADQEPTYWVRVLRGYCQFGIGDTAASHQEFWSLWNDTRDQPGGQVAGWSAFRADQVEDAITIYRDLLSREPANSVFRHDLGQMLLVQGKLSEGISLVEEGIAASTSASELRLLATADFDYVRHATAGTTHGTEVANALAQLGRRIEQRCTELLAARRPAESAAAMLAAARVAEHDGRPREALAIYRGFIGNPEVPEARQAVIAAADQVCAAGDTHFAEHEHEVALAHWAAATDALEQISPAQPELVRALKCRREMADLIAGPRDGTGAGTAGWLAEVAADREYRLALLAAAGTLASDVSHLWALHDGLHAVADAAGTGPDAHRLATEVADRLPFNQVYHLDAAEAVDYMFSFNNALELRFGQAAVQLCDSPELTEACSELLMRIEDEFGVRIPWPYAVPGPRLADHEVEVRVYVGWVGKTLLTGPAETWLPQVMRVLEDRVRNYLFRLVSVDDVPLWLEGWDTTESKALRWEPADPRADRLRLARVLRMLLRERVSVKDRRTIVEAVHSPTAAGKHYGSATLNTLREVRRRLGAEALGVGSDAVVVPLPAELADRVAGGTAGDRPVWELPRQQAHQLVTDLRGWLHAQPVAPAAISVADGRLRPFVWRLLAAERPIVRVLSEEELS